MKGHTTTGAGFPCVIFFRGRIIITVNSVKYPFEENSSLRKVSEGLSFDIELTVCGVNKNLVKKVDYDNFIVTGNNEIEVFPFVGGG